MAPEFDGSRVSTEVVPAYDRVEFWESHLRSVLVDLSCSAYSEHGLTATMTDIRLGDLRLFDISANAHVVQRTPANLSSGPSDSIFLNVILEGVTALLDSNVHTPGVGDAVMYDTALPYLLGFPKGMRHLLLRIPRDLIAERAEMVGRGLKLESALVLGRGSPAETAEVAKLSSVLRSLISTPRRWHDVKSAQDTILDLAVSLVDRRTGDGGSSLWVALKSAHEYVDEHLGDLDLTPGKVAAFLGISLRHLRRIFEIDEISPARYILQRRLLIARGLLCDPHHRPTTIADVAYQCGFSSHAHFSRTFHEYFGMTPRSLREAMGGTCGGCNSCGGNSEAGRIATPRRPGSDLCAPGSVYSGHCSQL
jgi:AraC-like DNA-binding protein